MKSRTLARVLFFVLRIIKLFWLFIVRTSFMTLLLTSISVRVHRVDMNHIMIKKLCDRSAKDSVWGRVRRKVDPGSRPITAFPVIFENCLPVSRPFEKLFPGLGFPFPPNSGPRIPFQVILHLTNRFAKYIPHIIIFVYFGPKSLEIVN